MAETDVLAAPQIGEAIDGVKRRAACDECRTKKLKCTGEHPTCSRCVRENIQCVYSPQKQMGRPKKRSRTEDDPLPPSKNGRQSINAWDQLGQGTGENTFDASLYETAFTPGGSIQPWLQNSVDWNADSSLANSGHMHNHGASDNGVPGLTPDNSSSHSPPILNLPPELGHHNGSIAPGQVDHRDSSTFLLLDPALAGPPGSGNNHSSNDPLGCSPATIPDCACLSSMYLTLNTLQCMDTYAFPFALHPLREAMQTASGVLSCDKCPKRFITAIQNTQLVGTLLMSIAERFSKVLGNITSESVRASVADERKKFRLADLNTSTSHLHTGGIGCVAAFSIDLSADEWRSMCKKVVRAEVHGPSSGNDCCCYFVGVLKQMEDRQTTWHNGPRPRDFPRDDNEECVAGERANNNRDDEAHGDQAGGSHGKKGNRDYLCLRLVDYSKKLVVAFDWS